MASDFFADKTYQQMDWISQAVSPWDYDLLHDVAALPERIELTPDLLNACWGEHYHSANIEDVVSVFAKNNGLNTERLGQFNSWEDIFKVEVDGAPILNTKTKTIEGGSIALVKIKPTLDDTDCRQIAKDRLRSLVYYNVSLGSSASMARAGEILDLLGISPAQYRSARKRCTILYQTLCEIVEEDKWRIRSMALIEKLGNWVCDYVEHGNLHGMANFAKLKVMTHNGQPIYSIKEEE